MTFEARDNAAKVVPASSGNNNEDERKASLKVTIFTVILSRAGGKSENLGGHKQAEGPIIFPWLGLQPTKLITFEHSIIQRMDA